jgi:hypothetical protein
MGAGRGETRRKLKQEMGDGSREMEDPDFRYSISDLPFAISRYPILFLNVKLRTVLVDDIYCELGYNSCRR